jgi:ubiquinone biosynthesis protein UbiJ
VHVELSFLEVMSEERLERIENQLSQIIQGMTAMQQNQNALREDVVALRHRIDSVEGTVKVAITDGFRSHDLYLDDMNIDLAANERQTRRLNRRVERLERNETN